MNFQVVSFQRCECASHLLYDSCCTVLLCFSRYFTIILKKYVYIHIYYFYKNFYKLIIVQHHKVDCVSGVPKIFGLMSKSDLQIYSWIGTWSYVGDLLCICFWFLRSNGSWYILSSQKRGLLNWNGFSVPFRVISFRYSPAIVVKKQEYFFDSWIYCFPCICVHFFLSLQTSFLQGKDSLSLIFINCFCLFLFVCFCYFEEGSCALVAWRILASLARDWTHDPCRSLASLGSPSF